MSMFNSCLMKTLKFKPSAQFAYNYIINVLSKCSNIISHRSSIFEGRHIDHRSSKIDTSIFEGQHIDHRSSMVNTSTINLRRSTHRSAKVVTSIFEGRHLNLQRLKAETSHRQPNIARIIRTEYCPQRHSIIYMSIYVAYMR